MCTWEELMIKIDNVDKKILQVLFWDARIKIKDLAKEVGVSINTLNQRVKRLKDKKVIIGTTLSKNMALIGYPFLAIIGVNLDPKCEQDIMRTIRKRSKVMAIHKTIGGFDMIVFVVSKTINELDNLKQVIKRNNGVRNTSLMILQKLHLNYEAVDLKT